MPVDITRGGYVVAPLAGAWIEMALTGKKNHSQSVAPLAGAWIEIALATYRGDALVSRSPCGSVD